MLSLQDLCVQKLALVPEKVIKPQLNWLAYSRLEAYKIQQGFDEWTAKIKKIEFELKIEDMLIERDIAFGEPAFIINVLWKNADVWEAITEFDDNYRELIAIAEKKGMLDFDLYELSEFDEMGNECICCFQNGEPIQFTYL